RQRFSAGLPARAVFAGAEQGSGVAAGGPFERPSRGVDAQRTLHTSGSLACSVGGRSPTLRRQEWLPTRPGEGFITSLMFAYIFGVLCFYYIVKPLKDGLFLANSPSADLPYPNFITALFAGTLATLVFKLGRRVSAIMLLTATNF